MCGEHRSKCYTILHGMLHQKKKSDHLMIGAERWAVVIISALNVITSDRDGNIGWGSLLVGRV